MSIYKGTQQICGQENMIIDTTLSTTSGNAIANKIVTTEINKKANIDSPSFTGSISLDRKPSAAFSIGEKSTSLGTQNAASGNSSFANGYQSIAYRDYSFASGYNSRAWGYCSVAFGQQSDVGDKDSEDIDCGKYSFASGINHNVTGKCSTAFGNDNTISGSYSFSTGTKNQVKGHASATIGGNLISAANYQTVLGLYNVEDTASVLVVGGGTDTTRSNAMTLSRAGDAIFNGSVTSNGFKLKPIKRKDATVKVSLNGGIGAVSGMSHSGVVVVGFDIHGSSTSGVIYQPSIVLRNDSNTVYVRFQTWTNAGGFVNATIGTEIDVGILYTDK